ncbi:ABC transporter substrate-binding protein [Ideonella azotifigens]|uniref:ABC transporter substrate-binding protein n=1 Tax=Ideonella azotifigens TaxID=513160 RepID=A0ABN1JM04_9BURK|nr:ABC transporter substrate-binding protein [Ideonella azotifigens]MCD2339783.1 ABC transporter substrate-binding protein [Ideonella azotifigens]
MSTDSDTSLLPIDPSRRQVLGFSAAAAAGLAIPALGMAAPAPAATAGGKKVLRYAFQIAETGFDPPKLSDIYSRIVTQHIFEGLFTYDHLARPAKIKPLTAAAMPEISADFRVYTVKIKPGIFFASDEAFGGKPRELVAQDYVYALKRFADPANKAPPWGDLEEADFIGLNALREESLAKRTPFDYDREVPGLRALDRYTIRFEVVAARPRLLELLAGGDLYGAVAREVVEHYGEQIPAHPVGTGPFKLVQWRRSSLIVLERNPEYREMLYAAEPAADDAEGQALLARFKGRRLPMIDRVEVSIIEENQPRWLSFLNQQNDFVERVPEEFITTAMPGGQVAPNLKRHGVQGYRVLTSDIVLTLYNMEHPVIGGYTPERVALRRAINLGVDIQREIDQVRRGQGIKAQAMEVPNTTGYDPHFKSEMSDYDPARARALLDMFGYVDKDGDGWREQPDGSPLVLIKHTQPDQKSRQLDELWQRNMNALGLKIEFSANKWPENLRAAQAGSVMIWGVASSAAQPDGQGALGRLYGPLKGSANLARFENKALDEIYLKMQGIPDGPERNALFREAKRIAIAYAPYKCHLHRYVTDMAHPWIIGYRRPDFWQDWWQYVDVDDSKRKA